MLQPLGQILARHRKVLFWSLGAVPFTLVVWESVFNLVAYRSTIKEFLQWSGQYGLLLGYVWFSLAAFILCMFIAFLMLPTAWILMTYLSKVFEKGEQKFTWQSAISEWKKESKLSSWKFYFVELPTYACPIMVIQFMSASYPISPDTGGQRIVEIAAFVWLGNIIVICMAGWLVWRGYQLYKEWRTQS